MGGLLLPVPWAWVEGGQLSPFNPNPIPGRLSLQFTGGGVDDPVVGR